jgi:hypothetical protein
MMLMSPLSSSKKIDSTRLLAGIFLPVFFSRTTETSSIFIFASAPAVLGSKDKRLLPTRVKVAVFMARYRNGTVTP